MQHHTLACEALAILIDVVASVFSFVIGAGWWKVSGRAFHRDSALFWAKICGGICAFGILLDFIT